MRSPPLIHRYQSSLDLSAATYASIRHLPLSRDLAHHARQQLVSRLDDHAQKHPHLFQKASDESSEPQRALSGCRLGGAVAREPQRRCVVVFALLMVGAQVIDVLTAEIMPVLRESGMAGRVEYVCDMRLFNDHPRAAQMLIDILTDRGYSASHSTEVAHVPISSECARPRCDPAGALPRDRRRSAWAQAGEDPFRLTFAPSLARARVFASPQSTCTRA